MDGAMKAETAMITINGRSVLKVLLQPETEKEDKFLEEAFDKCEDYKLSFAWPPCKGRVV